MPEEPQSAKKLGRRAQSKLERQDRIMMAARQLFAEEGYDATTLRQVAADAGLGLGTLFNYISNKRDLIYLIFNDEVDLLTDKALAAPRAWQTLEAKIASITEPHYRMFGSEPVLSRILLSEILLHSPGLHLEKHLSIRGRLIRGIEELVAAAQETGEIARVGSPELIARHLFFTFSAALRWWLASCSKPDWRIGQKEFEQVLHLQLVGLKVPEAPLVATKRAVEPQPGKKMLLVSAGRKS